MLGSESLDREVRIIGCNCGGQRTTAMTTADINEGVAASAVGQQYRVTYPDGTHRDFAMYLDAAVERAQTPGATLAGV